MSARLNVPKRVVRILTARLPFATKTALLRAERDGVDDISVPLGDLVAWVDHASREIDYFTLYGAIIDRHFPADVRDAAVLDVGAHKGYFAVRSFADGATRVDSYEPAKYLGGDYFDYLPLPDGKLAVVLADVAGKGAAAALLMAKLSAETRTCLALDAKLSDAVARLNRIFSDSRWEDRFVTLVVAVLDPASHEVILSNAGHMAPLLRRPDGKIVPIAEEETQLPLGVVESIEYPHHTRPLAPGESLTMFTDGITEAMNGQGKLYGSERLLKCLTGAPGGASALGPAILGDVKTFVGDRNQSDDMCLVCLGFGGSKA